MSTLGIDYLKRSVGELVGDFNEYAQMGDVEETGPQILGVLFTMIQIYQGTPIAAQRQFIAQTRRLGVPVFDCSIRENKTIFADAPQDGLPVVLNYYSPGTHSDIVQELANLAQEFSSKVGL